MKKFTHRFIAAIVTIASLGFSNEIKAQLSFTQTSPYDTLVSSPDSLGWIITSPQNFAFGTATLTVYYEGDFGSTSEFISVYDESGNLIGTTQPYFDGSDCMSDSVTLLFPASRINNWLADNQLDFTGISESSVGTFCTSNHARIKLDYMYCTSGPLASLSIPSNTFCPIDAPVALTFAPAGGTLSGPGISGTNFDPAGFMPGTYTLTYTFTNDSSCTTTAEVYVTINQGPLITSISPDTICPWNTSTITVDGTGHIVWYSDAGLTTPVDTGNTFTTPQLFTTTTYYAATTLYDRYFVITSLTDADSMVVDHDSLTGDDRGGIAVTTNFVYVVGDDSTARFDLNLQNPVKYPRMDGLASDLATGTLFTLYNPIVGIPDADLIDSMYVTQLRSLNPNLTLGTGVITLSDSIPFGWDNAYNFQSGVFAGNGFIILFSAPRSSWYVIDLQDGVVTDLGSISNPEFNFSETWAAYGIAEFNGTDYSVLFRDENDDNIHRRVLPDQASTIAFPFTDLSDLASFTYAPWNNRWYFHFEGGSQFNGIDETLVYATATDSTGAETGTSTLYCPVDATVFVDVCLGIQETNVAEINVYPNPTDGNFTISLSNMEDALVEIVSMDGRIVYSSRFTGSTTKTVDLSTLANGIYSVHVSNETTVLTKKLIKN
ncbi:MAG: T9SS type A sorting domain-containing protein [Bacteroidota bacterium]|nr:T9SS type A sorting domain-containing protein [Bacteroidota bacterium]